MMRAWPLIAASSLLAGCGGGAALLHGAHVLGEGKTSLAGGVSGNFVSGEAARELAEARSAPPAAGGAPLSAPEGAGDAYARGAAAVAAIGPAVAPFVAARVGLPYDTEAGLSYTGRAVRLDGRYAYQGEQLALSVGAGLSAPLLSRGATNGQLHGLSFAQKSGKASFGVDAPMLVGYRSPGGIVSLWAGPRVGYERLAAEASFGIESPARSGELSLERVYYGGVFGLALGFRHLYGAIELDIARQSFFGEIVGYEIDSSAFTVAPAAALIAKF